MIGSMLKGLPAPLTGEKCVRKEPCRVCGSQEGIKIGEVDYWDIQSSDLVKCPNCQHTQLDPMLNEEETARGCLAYYIEEGLRSGQQEMQRNAVRNFRRGVLFARGLQKRGEQPQQILELGPGSGYFSQGIQFVFPEAQVTVMDVNQEVLDFNKSHHGYATVQGIPDRHVVELDNRFDLVIARDILEHVTDVRLVVQQVKKYLKKGGLFHFITPNGQEDVWKHYLRYKNHHEPSELLINHVNYFDGKGLKELLKQEGLNPVEYYTYKIKTSLKGKGRKNKPKLVADSSKRRAAGDYIGREKELQAESWDKQSILNEWYINPQNKGLAYAYSSFQHGVLFKINPEYNVGHEFYGIFRKESSK
ncbi:class I SAM-dependent methyltransferase [bacterium SCSIO 12741]|nr:class I SAM-dependent methyltransferase [bacterium SCSIO 12741]